jgi:hypothetical protein
MLSIPELQHSHHTVCSLQLQQVFGKVAGQHSRTSKQTQPCLQHSVHCPAEVEGVALKRFDAGPVKLSEGARTVSAKRRAVVRDQACCTLLPSACCVHRPLAGCIGLRTTSVHCHSLFIAAMCKIADKGVCILSCGHTILTALCSDGIARLCHCCHALLLQPGSLGVEQQRPQSSAGQVRQ